ncbi:TPA: hypothetical protein LU109_003590 [Enterobacter hormaechei subsp. xiangfangensis]|nr:hypothetical protein [Enterobacter hormaechei subsp. xiangfangensis]
MKNYIVRYGFNYGGHTVEHYVGFFALDKTLQLFNTQCAADDFAASIKDTGLAEQPIMVRTMGRHFIREIMHYLDNKPSRKTAEAMIERMNTEMRVWSQVVEIPLVDLPYYRACHEANVERYLASQRLMDTEEQHDRTTVAMFGGMAVLLVLLISVYIYFI